MALYARHVKPFEHSKVKEDSEDEDFLSFGTKRSNKRKAVSSPIKQQKVASDMSTKSKSKEVVNLSDEDDEINESEKLQIEIEKRFKQAEAEAEYISTPTKVVKGRKGKKVVDLAPSPGVVDINGEEDAAIRKANLILQKCKTAEINNQKQPSRDTDTVDLSSASGVYIPTIKRSTKPVPTAGSTNDLSIDSLSKLVGKPTTGTSSSSSSTAQATNNNLQRTQSIGPQVKLKTRLNGSHEWKWKVSTNETFSKIRVKFAEIYGLPIDSMKFIFDGDTIDFSDTPTSLDMEDDNMIDVKIDKKLYDAAVATADKKKP